MGPAQPPSQRVPGVKRQMLEADHSPTPSANNKNVWSYISIPHVHGVHTYNCTFTLPQMWKREVCYSEDLILVSDPFLVTG
jgi:hypothetical protein